MRRGVVRVRRLNEELHRLGPTIAACFKRTVLKIQHESLRDVRSTLLKEVGW
jgi:hypothetical protein